MRKMRAVLALTLISTGAAAQLPILEVRDLVAEAAREAVRSFEASRAVEAELGDGPCDAWREVDNDQLATLLSRLFVAFRAR